MRKITFDGTNLNDYIDKLYTADIERPLVAPKRENKTEIPGKNFAYDFGNNYKQDYDITVEFVLIPGEGTNIQAEQEKLEDVLDVSEAKTMTISDSSKEYKAQVVGGIIPEKDRYNQISRITVIFEVSEVEE